MAVANGVAVQVPTPVPGRIAARIDRLPLTPVQWELAILTQIAWGLIIVDTDGIAGRLYPFVWAPANVLSVVVSPWPASPWPASRRREGDRGTRKPLPAVHARAVRGA